MLRINVHSQHPPNRHQYQKRYYQPSPAWERFYDIVSDQILEKNGGIDKIEFRKAVAHVKANDEEEHERNIKDMIQYDEYKSPCKNKDATVAKILTTVNNPLDDTGYTYLVEDHAYSSDSDKKAWGEKRANQRYSNNKRANQRTSPCQ